MVLGVKHSHIKDLIILDMPVSVICIIDIYLEEMHYFSKVFNYLLGLY